MRKRDKEKYRIRGWNGKGGKGKREKGGGKHRARNRLQAP